MKRTRKANAVLCGVVVSIAGGLGATTRAGELELAVPLAAKPTAVVDAGLQIDPAYWLQPVPLQQGALPGSVDSIAVPANTNPLLHDVLVHLNPALKRAAVERADVKTFVAARGGNVKYEYGTVLPNVLALRDLTDADVEALKKMPGVVRVEEDMYHPNVVKLDEATPVINALQSQITAAGLSADGTGIRVCICDTGIDMDHTMYSARIDAAASWDFANNDSNPDDDHGHGSHVAGIAVGRTGLTVDFGCGVKPFQGVAPNATLIGAKILNSAGGGTDSDIIAGIDHCADQSPSGGQADVINLSIGTGNYSGTCTHSWAVAANNAVANGVVVVAASGNENNSNSMGSPACGADVIAVGATYKDTYPNCEDTTATFNWSVCTDNSPSVDQVVCFSNESDLLDVSAPGSVILSASNAAGGTSIIGMSGTSMASPAVAGLAALILDADPTLTPAQVRQIIRDGADDLGPAGFDRAYGYGRINAIGSLNLITPCSIDPDCDDGQFCNGAETCNAGSCIAGTDPCPGQACDEVNDQCVVAPAVVYEWNMNTNPGWSMQGQWAYGTPTGGGGAYGSPDPTSGATGSNVIGYNLNGDYGGNLAETHLTTTAIDCTNLINVSVAFQRWLGVETSQYDHAYVRVSNDGSNWTTVWQNSGEVADASWASYQYDISAVADGQATVYIRWTMGTTDGSWQYCGWNIDDVQIIATDLGGGATCSDGIQNQGEDRIDCGGPCPACACTSDPACDNGQFCDGAETCDAFGVCQSGTVVNCDDGVGCTDDSCNEATDTCDNTTNDANCDNGLFCDGVETCDAVLDCQSGTPVDCNDGVGCTDDSCNEATDTCDNITNDGLCDNGLYCDGIETCDAVLDCQAGTPVDCNDGVGCTDDSCNETTNTCDNIANAANCDNGVYCDGVETCDAVLDCQSGAPVNCDDGIGCTMDSCNEATNTCDNITNDGLCDNGLYCDGIETCDAVLDCQAGASVNCDDGVGCTDDSCNEATDSCDNIANNANCDNSLFCDGVETCDAVLDCQAGADPCVGLQCDEAGDACVECLVDGDCDNGVYCDGTETCVAFACQPGAPLNCDDGVGCTDDSCNEVTQSCDNIANNANCDNGLFCDGAETCDAVLDCQAGSDPCGGLLCDEPTDTCAQCFGAGDCDNGLYCDGAETCVAGACQAGTPVNCDDGVGCTVDSCNNTTSSCDNVASDAACDNGLFCDGAEVCHVTLDCMPGALPCTGSVWCAESTNACMAFGNGDFDGDLDVDLVDFQAFASCFGVSVESVSACSAGNLIGLDGLIDLADYAEFAVGLDGSGPQ